MTSTPKPYARIRITLTNGRTGIGDYSPVLRSYRLGGHYYTPDKVRGWTYELDEQTRAS